MSTEAETKKRISVRITGRVQGVGFRHFTRMQARRLNVDGWVRNEPDGSVRLEAEGPKDALEELVRAVQDGPRAAHVENVNVNWKAAQDAFEAFSVRYA